MNDADYIERCAQHYESFERDARRWGLFSLAVCYQHIAGWVRDRVLVRELRGMGALSLLIHASDGGVVALGTIPYCQWHEAARYLTYAAELKGFPKPPTAEELEEQRQELAAQVQYLAEAIAVLRHAPHDGSP